jgi:hypothetical protein
VSASNGSRNISTGTRTRRRTGEEDVNRRNNLIPTHCTCGDQRSVATVAALFSFIVLRSHNQSLRDGLRPSARAVRRGQKCRLLAPLVFSLLQTSLVTIHSCYYPLSALSRLMTIEPVINSLYTTQRFYQRCPLASKISRHNQHRYTRLGSVVTSYSLSRHTLFRMSEKCLSRSQKAECVGMTNSCLHVRLRSFRSDSFSSPCSNLS